MVIKIRNGVFETNSSSTHALVYNKEENYGFLSPSRQLIINFVNANGIVTYNTLREKVSYLVSQIINKYKYDVLSYEDLIEEVEENHDFQRIKKYVKERYDRDIVFPEKYEGDLDEIVDINHQLTDWHDLDELLRDMVTYSDLLGEVLSPSSSIELDRD
jgi:hypothetical protein